VVWLPAAILLAISGSPGRGLIVAGAGVGIVSAVDNVLRPMLMSGGTRMNGLLILIALLGGVEVFGMLGLVLGPILVATALALLKTYMAHAPGKTSRSADL
jgi:predicted PurR-regulated permease PerM